MLKHTLNYILLLPAVSDHIWDIKGIGIGITRYWIVNCSHKIIYLHCIKNFTPSPFAAWIQWHCIHCQNLRYLSRIVIVATLLKSIVLANLKSITNVQLLQTKKFTYNERVDFGTGCHKKYL